METGRPLFDGGGEGYAEQSQQEAGGAPQTWDEKQPGEGRDLFTSLGDLQHYEVHPYMADQLLKDRKELAKVGAYDAGTRTGDRSDAFSFLFTQAVKLPESTGYGPAARAARGDHRSYVEDLSGGDIRFGAAQAETRTLVDAIVEKHATGRKAGATGGLLLQQKGAGSARASKEPKAAKITKKEAKQLSSMTSD